jgi:hypothetical protein
VPAPTTQARRPVAGPRFRRAAALPIQGEKRRRLLSLLAAWADVGETSPPMRDLVKRLGHTPKKMDQLLASLAADGWIAVEWAGPGRPGNRGGPCRNRYTLGSWARDDTTTDLHGGLSSVAVSGRAHGRDTQPAQRPNARPSLTGHNGTHPTPEQNSQTPTRAETP